MIANPFELNNFVVSLLDIPKLSDNCLILIISGALSKLLMYVGMPFLILTSTINNITFDSSLLATIGIVAGIGILYTLIMFFVSKPLTAMEREEKTRGMMRFSSVFTNNGFLGIPLAMAVFGAGSKVLMVVIIMKIKGLSSKF